ncbi:MAG: helix-turn-helix domain-containing protein [Caldilineaceae bacterium]
MTNSLVLERETILPSTVEIRLAQETGRKLATYYRNQETVLLRLLDQQNQPQEIVELPASALQLLLDILAQMANGNAVQLTPIQAELTTQQAAELLNVSHGYLLELLETGQLSSRMIGAERRVFTDELLAYQRDIAAKRLQVLNELTAYDQELGLQ